MGKLCYLSKLKIRLILKEGQIGELLFQNPGALSYAAGSGNFTGTCNASAQFETLSFWEDSDLRRQNSFSVRISCMKALVQLARGLLQRVQEQATHFEGITSSHR